MNFFRTLQACVLAVSSLSLTVGAEAAIIANPVTIIDHGDYITDTVNHRDWYKFSNAVTTLGQSYDQVSDANSVFRLAGWNVSTMSSVRGLWEQYGYVGDTPAQSLTANAGLTDALGSDLGYSRVEPQLSYLLAITSDIAVNNNQLFTYMISGIPTFQDFVDSSQNISAQAANPAIGVWLSRASVEDPGMVPEPGTLALFGMAGIALVSLRRRRATLPRRSVLMPK